MAKAGLIGWGGAIAIALGMAQPVAAQGLDPQVAGPLMQLIQAAGMQCQSGNQQGCIFAGQLQQMGQELTQAQFACQQGNPQACQVFQMGAQRVQAGWQQVFGGGGGGMAPNAGGYSPQQQAWDHQQRMQQQQFQFQQQQQQYQQQQRQNDWNHQRYMDTLRR
jgi:hypothetical protein